MRTANNKPPAAWTPQRPMSVGPPQSVGATSARSGYAKLSRIPSNIYALSAELTAPSKRALSHQLGFGRVTGRVSPIQTDLSAHSSVGARDDRTE